MIKPPIDLQDLRRRIDVKAKAEPSWRFWGLYVHVCKRETLDQAYWLAKKNVAIHRCRCGLGTAIIGRTGTLANGCPSVLMTRPLAFTHLAQDDPRLSWMSSSADGLQDFGVPPESWST